MPKSVPVREMKSTAAFASLGYRAFGVNSYKVLYRIEDETVIVAHVFHRSQDYAKLV